jgi:predicted alpha/beta hydrolase family esterase
LEKRSAILVGHSLGGSVLLKYLSEEGAPISAAGLFLVAAPYWGAEGWKVDDFALDSEFASRLPRSLEIFLYHSREDPEVPFAHAAIYAARLSQATFRAIGGSEHEFKDGLRELADDIKGRESID